VTNGGDSVSWPRGVGVCFGPNGARGQVDTAACRRRCGTPRPGDGAQDAMLGPGRTPALGKADTSHSVQAQITRPKCQAETIAQGMAHSECVDVGGEVDRTPAS